MAHGVASGEPEEADVVDELTRPQVLAAGGLVWRPAGASAEVLVVHRPRYDDWSFPKGKCDPGEGAEACARREVEEEAGLQCELGRELPPTRYVDAKGRHKLVRYWEMVPIGEVDWAPGDEVDERAWLPLDEAARRLTYAHDVEVLRAFMAAFMAS